MKSRWFGLIALAALCSQAFAQQPPVLLDNNAATPVAQQGAQTGLLRSQDDAAAIVGRYGTIKSVRDVGASGLKAWTVEKNGHSVVLYTTPDVAVVFTGIIWDAKTGKNISDQFLPGVQPTAAVPAPAAEPAAAVRTAAAMDGKFKGDVPESIKTVDALAGIKEGKGGPADTVYIIMDPRCPWCQRAYAATRAYVKKGYTIKWIPSLALGDPAGGAPIAATLLQSKDPEIIDRIMGHHEQIRSTPTPATLQQLQTNLDFLFATFQANSNVDKAGVPVAFYLDHRTGKPRMMTGVHAPEILADIFGPL